MAKSLLQAFQPAGNSLRIHRLLYSISGQKQLESSAGCFFSLHHSDSPAIAGSKSQNCLSLRYVIKKHPLIPWHKVITGWEGGDMPNLAIWSPDQANKPVSSHSTTARNVLPASSDTALFPKPSPLITSSPAQQLPRRGATPDQSSSGATCVCLQCSVSCPSLVALGVLDIPMSQDRLLPSTLHWISPCSPFSWTLSSTLKLKILGHLTFCDVPYGTREKPQHWPVPWARHQTWPRAPGALLENTFPWFLWWHTHHSPAVFGREGKKVGRSAFDSSCLQLGI